MPQHGARKLIASVSFGLLMLGNAAESAHAQFATMNTELMARIPLSGFSGSPGNGNDCWGYVSPSGREYALMGLSNSLAVVEVTNPSSPVIVGQVSHTNSLWGDVKVYQHYCYVSNESGGGIDVIDLSQVDAGIVTLVQRMTANGVNTTHNVALNEASGFLYLCGSNVGSGRIMAFSLANPANPVFAGQASATVGTYSHDAQIVTYTSGPYAGREIAFSCNGATGVDIYDVTNKANITRLSRTVYPNLTYCHQAWLSEDRQYLYVNDETDGVNETVILDVTDLSAPVMVGSYNSGTSSADHNLYVQGEFIFEADYRGGARIFCAANPTSPVQVGWIDTYPANDNTGFNGAWSVYPYLPSGILLVSDIESGLFIVDVTQALSVGTLAFGYPKGRPDRINSNAGTELHVDVSAACGASVQPGSALLHYDTGSGFTIVAMSETAPQHYHAMLPSADCATEVRYFVSAQTTAGQTIYDPAGAPLTSYHAVVADQVMDIFSDNCETDMGWTTEVLGATAGHWQRGVPVNDPAWEYDPSEDADHSGQCWLTQNALGNTDVDGGAVRLISPSLDMSSGDLTFAYSYYLFLTIADGIDKLLVEISSNGLAGPWTVIASHTASSGQSSVDHLESFWQHVHISDAQLAALGVSLTSNMRVRFTANDGGTASIVEAGVDAIEIHRFICNSCGPVDINCDGAVGVPDLLAVISAWGACPSPPPSSCPADVAPMGGDGNVGVPDLLMVISNWG